MEQEHKGHLLASGTRGVLHIPFHFACCGRGGQKGLRQRITRRRQASRQAGKQASKQSLTDFAVVVRLGSLRHVPTLPVQLLQPQGEVVRVQRVPPPALALAGLLGRARTCVAHTGQHSGLVSSSHGICVQSGHVRDKVKPCLSFAPLTWPQALGVPHVLLLGLAIPISVLDPVEVLPAARTSHGGQQPAA
jgi:hypothetical protein